MTFGDVLTPVRERYGYWLSLDAAGVDEDRAEAPEEVRAIQIVLRMERSGAPSRCRALELAAAGCALLCLDERSAPGGPWHEAVLAYGQGHIRKVTRRARGAAWHATADLPGLTLVDDDGTTRVDDATDLDPDEYPTQIRVLVPGRVVDLDKAVAKLQVSGTEIEPDATPAPTPPDGPLLTCILPTEVGMSTGKLMAQTGHAGMTAAALAAATDPELLRTWYDAGCPTRAEFADTRAWAELRDRMADPAAAWREEHLLAIRDGGYTEVAPGTMTVLATLH